MSCGKDALDLIAIAREYVGNGTFSATWVDGRGHRLEVTQTWEGGVLQGLTRIVRFPKPGTIIVFGELPEE